MEGKQRRKNIAQEERLKCKSHVLVSSIFFSSCFFFPRVFSYVDFSLQKSKANNKAVL